ncbi:MAG TPA: hypothetical protein VGD55_03090 [Acidothermaceae bacterium]
MRWFLARFCSALVAAFCVAAIPTHTSTVPEHPVPPVATAPAGNVTLSVPTASIAPADGLPSVLARGHHYQLTVHVWVAGREPRTVATVSLAGAVRSACVVKAVPAGTVATLRCTVTPTQIGAAGLRVSVSVVGAHGVPIVATFDHPVVAT